MKVEDQEDLMIILLSCYAVHSPIEGCKICGTGKLNEAIFKIGDRSFRISVNEETPAAGTVGESGTNE